MSAKAFIDAPRGGGGGGGNGNSSIAGAGEKARGGQQQPAATAAQGGAAFINNGGDGGMSRFDRLVSNRDFDDEEQQQGGNDEPASACPYGSMGGTAASASPSGAAGIQRSDFTASSGDGIELVGGGGTDDDDDDVSIMEPEEAVQVRLTGYMKKFAVGRSGFFKNWKRRFFVCDGGLLQYYENETAKDPLSVIDLAGGAGLRLITRPSKRTHPEVLDPAIDMVLVFREPNSNEELKLLMRADSPDDHMQWAVVIGAFTPLVDHAMDFPVEC